MAVTCILNSLFPLSLGKALKTICPTVLCDIQPLLSALMIRLWSVLNLVCFIQMFTRMTRLSNASQETSVSIRVWYWHV